MAMTRLFTLALPRPHLRTVVVAGLGGFLAIAALALLTGSGSVALLMAPFGASCVLLFAAPSAPLSQPPNVVGGHFVASFVGLGLHMWLPGTWWGVAIAVGCAIAMMVALRVTHPPAGADPLVVFATDPGLGFLFAPVLAGSATLVLIALAFHRVNGTAYPAGSSQ